MKNEYSDGHQIEFYSPGGNNYHSKVKLWFIAKISNNNGRLWLETLWNESEGDIDRLSVFTSKLDAEIQCLSLNSNSLGSWKVYPFDELNLHLMMKTMFSRGHSVLGISMIFGFSSSADSELSSRSKGLSTVSSACDIPLDNSALQETQPVIEFGSETFRFIADCWANTIPDFVASTSEINDLCQEDISTIAADALRCAALRTAPPRTVLAGHVSTFCPTRQSWITSPKLNRNHIH